jgi:hypothetical protein
VEGLEHCFISVGEDVTEVSEFGITVKGRKNKLYIYSSNNEAVSRYILKRKNEDDFDILLPGVFCNNLRDMVRKLGAGVMTFYDNYVFATFSDDGKFVGLYSKLKPVELLPFEKTLKKFTKVEDFIPVDEEFISIIKKSLVLTANDTDKIITVDVSSKSIGFCCDTGMGKLSDSLQKECQIGECRFKIDAFLLNLSISRIEEFTFIEKDGRIYFVGRAENFLHLIESFSDEISF